MIKLKNVVLFLILGLICFASNLYAQEPIKTESPYFLIVTPDADVTQLVLKSTSVTANIIGILADVQVKQVYVYEGIKTINSVYVFPISKNSIAYGFNVKIGQRELKGQTVGREEAFKKCVEREWTDTNTPKFSDCYNSQLNTIPVDSLKQGDTIVFHSSYCEQLMSFGGIYHFSIPNSKKATDLKYTNNEYSDYIFDIQIELDADMEVKNVKSNIESAKIVYSTKNRVACRYQTNVGLNKEKEFDFEYRLSADKLKTALFLYKGKTENFFMALVQAPKKDKIKSISRECVFIIDDRNGCLYKNRELFEKLIKPIILSNHINQFNIIFASANRQFLSPYFYKGDENGLLKAEKAIIDTTFYADFDLTPYLEKAYEENITSNYSRDVIFCTNGYVSIDENCYDLICKNKSKTNLFVIGMSHSNYNGFVLNSLARKAETRLFKFRDKCSSDTCFISLFKYLESTSISKVRISFTNFNTFELNSLNYCNLTLDRPIIIIGKWTGVLRGRMQINGLMSNSPFQQSFDIAKFKTKTGSQSLKYIWVKGQLDFINDSYKLNDWRNYEICEPKLMQLGLKYCVLTKLTPWSFIESVSIYGILKYKKLSLAKPLSWNVHLYGDENTAYLSYDKSEDYCSWHRYVVYETVKKDDFIEVVDSPQYPGGLEAIATFIKSNIIYPEDALRRELDGNVLVGFTVDSDGKVIDVKILKTDCDYFNNEAIRLVSKLDKWSPANQQGEKVPFKYEIPIHFKYKYE